MGLCQRAVSVVAFGVFGFLLVAGCGGGGVVGGGTGQAPGDSFTPILDPLPPGVSDPTALEGLGTALFQVDLDSGEVGVTPLQPAELSRALFTGSAIQFNSSQVLDQPGSTGVRVLRVSVTNRWNLPIGQLANGTVTGLRVLFDNFANGTGAPNLTLSTQVRTAQRLGDLTVLGMTIGTSDAVVVADYSGGRILRLANGQPELIAGGAAGGLDGVGAAAGFDNPYGLAVDPTDGALIVVEAGGRRVRRIDGSGRVTTVAGRGAATEGAGNQVTFGMPTSAVCATSGLMYVADYANNRVLRLVRNGDPAVAANWTVTTLTTSVPSPWGVALAPDGYLYVSSIVSHRIWRVSPAGQATAIAGDGTVGFLDGAGNTARFNGPTGLAWVDGVLFVSELDGNRIRRVGLVNTSLPGDAVSWQVATIAGGAGAGDVDGAGNVAQFNRPVRVVADSSGRLMVADYGNKSIRELTLDAGVFDLGTGNSTTSELVRLSNATGIEPIAQGGERPFIMYALDTPSSAALEPGATTPVEDWAFVVPDGVHAFSFTVSVLADTDVLVPPASATGAGSSDVMVSTFVGASSTGYVDGLGTQARFEDITGLAFDNTGTLFVADKDGGVIRMVSPIGEVVTIAGLAYDHDHADGTGNVARFNNPTGVAVTPDGTVVYVADQPNQVIRRMSLASGTDRRNPGNWTVSTIAGQVGTSAFVDGDGAAARFSLPAQLVLANPTTLIIGEWAGNRVRRMQWIGGDADNPSNWQVTLLAGSTAGASGTTDASGSAARFDAPRGLGMDLSGNVYLADNLNHRIRKITPTGQVTTFAGPTGAAVAGYQDGPAATARFNYPKGIAVDRSGRVYVGEEISHRIRMISPDGTVSTIAGSSSGSLDGVGNAARFENPIYLAVAPSGELYVAGGLSGAHTWIRRISRILGVGGP